MKKLVVAIMLAVCVACASACGTTESRKVTISFYSENNALIEMKEFDMNAEVSFNYEVSDTEEWEYTFLGWSTEKDGEPLSSLPKATENAVYYAIVRKQRKTPSITFSAQCDTADSAKSFGAGKLKELFVAETTDVAENKKSYAELLYDSAQYKIHTLQGDAEQVKEKINEIYKELYLNVKELKSTVEGLINQKEQIVKMLDAVYDSAKDLASSVPNDMKVAYETAKAQVEAFVDVEALKAGADEILSAFKDEIKQYVYQIIDSELTKIKNALKDELQEMVDRVISKIEDNDIKSALQGNLESVKNAIDKISSFDGINVDSENLKSALTENVKSAVASQLKKLKDKAIEEINAKKTELLDKITDTELRGQIDTLITAQLNEVAKINSLDDIDDALDTIKTNLTNGAQEIIASQLKKLKDKAIEEINAKKTELLGKITDTELRGQIDTLITAQLNEVAKINSLDDIDDALDTIRTNLTNGAQEIIASQLKKLKDKAIEEINAKKTELLGKITDTELRGQIDTLITAQLNEVAKIDSLDSAESAIQTIRTNLMNGAQEIIASQLKKLKDKAIEEINAKKTELLSKITDTELRGQIDTLITAQLNEVAKIDSLDGIDDALDTIRTNLTNGAQEIIASQLKKLKDKAILELGEIKDDALSKLPDGNLKTELNKTYNDCVAQINAINDLDSAKEAISSIKTTLTNTAKRLVASTIAELKAIVKEYANRLSDATSITPYSFIPDAMKPYYQANLISGADAVSYDFSGFVSVGSINYGGFGQPWNMVIDNITQSENFYKYLDKGFAVISTAFSVINDYYESEYSDSIDVRIEKENFTIEISYADGIFNLSIEFVSGIDMGILGNFCPKVEMTYYSQANEKEVVITATESNVMRYKVSDNKYEFGIKYGINGANCTSYLVIENKNGKTEGSIVEYFTAKGKAVLPSRADFVIDGDYVSVVGNKADPIIGMKGYIAEVYKKTEGKLLGYEVMEELTVAGVKGTYNTLWFNLSDISGIASIKIGDKTDANKSGKSTCDVYINGSETLFVPAYNKKAFVQTSRKYDIEFRTRYFYSKDADGNIIEHAVKIPMMFIQEDNDKDTNFSDYPEDMLSNNNVSSQVTLSETYLNKILDDYDALVPIFKEHEQSISSDYINQFING